MAVCNRNIMKTGHYKWHRVLLAPTVTLLAAAGAACRNRPVNVLRHRHRVLYNGRGVLRVLLRLIISGKLFHRSDEARVLSRELQANDIHRGFLHNVACGAAVARRGRHRKRPGMYETSSRCPEFHAPCIAAWRHMPSRSAGKAGEKLWRWLRTSSSQMK